MAIAVMGDDDFTSSLILRLSRLGFDAIPARRGQGAFARVLEGADVVVCASFTDAKDGVETAGRVPAPFLWVCPELPNTDTMLDAMRVGIVDVVSPGIGDGELGVRVRAALERARPSDIRIAGQLASLERDQRAGRYIQQRILPRSPLSIGHYRLAHRVRPSMILSGDFVDYFRIGDGHFVFYIADVSGHGASSALVTVILKNFSRRLRREHLPRMLKRPGEMLANLNRELLDQNLGKHVAMFIGVVDLRADTVTYANAGHFPHAIHAGGGEARCLECRGKPVGLFDDVAYDVGEVPLAAGESVVAFSDGVLEVMPEDGLPAKEARLVACAASHAPDVGALWDAVGVVPGATGPDDMTCLVVAHTI